MHLKHGFLLTCFLNQEQNALSEFKKLIFILNDDDSPNLINDKLNELCYEIKIKNMKNVVLVCTKQKPLEIYSNLCQAKMKTKQIKRLIPLQYIFETNKYEQVFNSICFDEIGEEHTYKISIEGRVFDKSLKDKLLNFLVKKVIGKVQLKNPDYIVVVQICGYMMGLSIVKNDGLNFNFSRQDKFIK